MYFSGISNIAISEMDIQVRMRYLHRRFTRRNGRLRVVRVRRVHYSRRSLERRLTFVDYDDRVVHYVTVAEEKSERPRSESIDLPVRYLWRFVVDSDINLYLLI